MGYGILNRNVGDELRVLFGRVVGEGGWIWMCIKCGLGIEIGI